MTPAHPIPNASREESAAILAYGMELARDRKGDRATLEDGIWAALQDAVAVMDAAPDQERAWLQRGNRSNFRDPGLNAAELAAIVKARVLSSVAVHDGRTRVGRERDLDRAMLTLDWLMHVRASRDGDRIGKAALALLRGDTKAMAAKLYHPERAGRPEDARRIHWEIKKRATKAIVTGIGRQHGVKAEFLVT